jgi:hypothetical protein
LPIISPALNYGGEKTIRMHLGRERAEKPIILIAGLATGE